jgi:hypothetical protein
MNAVLNDKDLRPAELLADLIERHGPWRVVAALAALLVRRARTAPGGQVMNLPDHLRRDVGLPDLPVRRVAPPPYRSSMDNPMFRL